MPWEEMFVQLQALGLENQHAPALAALISSGRIESLSVEGNQLSEPGLMVLADAITDIECPALVLTGEEDANSTPAMAAAMAGAFPDGRSAVIPVLRHMGLAEDPDAFNALLVPFLEASL